MFFLTDILQRRTEKVNLLPHNPRNTAHNRLREVIAMDKINHAIGCEVSDCKFNCEGKNCTLDRIMVGNTCECDAEKCTCCENYRRK